MFQCSPGDPSLLPRLTLPWRAPVTKRTDPSPAKATVLHTHGLGKGPESRLSLQCPSLPLAAGPREEGAVVIRG